VATAARLVTMELRQVDTGATLTFEEVGLLLARRLDRAGLITRSE
jgi:hypothetical protein